MAVKFNTTKVNGLFNADKIDFASVAEIGLEISCSTEVKDCKDPLFIILNLNDITVPDFNLKVVSADGKKQVVAVPEIGETSIIPITTHGFVKENGIIEFLLCTENGTFNPETPMKIAAVSYTPVENH